MPTATPVPTQTPLPPTPTIEPTPDLWATLIALPTSTPDTSGGGDPLPSPCRFDGGSIECSDDSGRNWTLPVNERVGCPINETIRRPYPRALVTNENTFALLPNEWFPSAGGKWSVPQNPYDLNGLVDENGNPTVENIVRNVRFGLRSQRLTKGTLWLNVPVEDVKWTFTGPSSNGDPGTQYGITTTYSYAAASYTGPGAPPGAVAGKGRAYDRARRAPSNAYDLSAYPITLQTYCGFWYSIAMERSVAYWQQLSSCINQELDEDDEPIMPAGFSHEGCPEGQIAFGETRHRWEIWTWIPWTRHDMREEGFDTPFVPVRRATGGGIFQNRMYQEPTGNGIWVPVVEVQTVQLGQ